MLLRNEIVRLNGIERVVAISIDNEKMFGKIGNYQFIWDYTVHELPVVKCKVGADKLKAAKYGRLYILERLKMSNVSLNIKTKERTVEYIHVPEEDGVWCNIFANGYIRGCINGKAFAWDILKYKVAVAVNEAGFNGLITAKIDTNKITSRLRKAGYVNKQSVLKAVISTQAKASSQDPFANNVKDVV